MSASPTVTTPPSAHPAFTGPRRRTAGTGHEGERGRGEGLVRKLTFADQSRKQALPPASFP